jgi:hypothetical protein
MNRLLLPYMGGRAERNYGVVEAQVATHVLAEPLGEVAAAYLAQ